MTQMLDILGCWAVRAVAGLFNKLPLGVAIGIGTLLGRLVFYFSSRRHVAYADLKAALGEEFDERERWRVIRDHYAHLGAMFVEILRFRSFDREILDKTFRIHHPERFYQAIDRGKGIVLLTGHFGNWELLQIVSGILGKPVHVLAREQKHFRLNQFLNELREIRGSVAVKRGVGIRDFLRALRTGELVGVLGDQDAGRDGGIISRLFGRKTTIPTGAFELANRAGALVLPSFIRRRSGPHHEIFVEEPIEGKRTRKKGGKIEDQVLSYTRLLEDMIRRYPDQWLWGSKRWKYTWTKRLLILLDGKAGHEKQANTLAAQFRCLKDQYGRPGMEYPVTTIQVAFRSDWHKRLFPFFCLLFLPWAQGRLRYLRFFFEEKTTKEIVAASADFVISAGASLTPLNLCLVKDSRAKSIVLMNPSFPFNLFRYDLAVVPAHDEGIIPKKSLRLIITPSEKDPGKFQDAAEKLKKGLRDPSIVKIGVFLGGSTRHFRMELSGIEKLFSSLERLSKRVGDYLVTTSRRTPDFIVRYLKNRVSRDPSCQMLVVAKEDSRPEVAPGMMALADILVVSEDSVSMISEAVSAGKKVVVLNLDTAGLPSKHRRFQDILVRESAVEKAPPEDLERKVLMLEKRDPPRIVQRESELLCERLQEIL